MVLLGTVDAVVVVLDGTLVELDVVVVLAGTELEVLVGGSDVDESGTDDEVGGSVVVVVVVGGPLAHRYTS